MMSGDVSRDPLYDRLAERVGQELAVNVLERLPPRGAEPATRQDVRDLAQRFGGVEERMDRLEERMDRLEERMDRLEERMDRLEERTDRQMERFDDKLDRFHEGLREQTRNVLLANAAMMLTLATILVGVGVVT